MSDEFWAGVLVSSVLWLLGMVVAVTVTVTIHQREAIRHNAAEWRVDSVTGETAFTWLTEPDAEQPAEKGERE